MNPHRPAFRNPASCQNPTFAIHVPRATSTAPSVPSSPLYLPPVSDSTLTAPHCGTALCVRRNAASTAPRSSARPGHLQSALAASHAARVYTRGASNYARDIHAPSGQPGAGTQLGPALHLAERHVAAIGRADKGAKRTQKLQSVTSSWTVVRTRPTAFLHRPRSPTRRNRTSGPLSPTSFEGSPHIHAGSVRQLFQWRP